MKEFGNTGDKKIFELQLIEKLQLEQTMRTNYDEIIPSGVLFNLKEVEEMKIIKVDMAKKLILKGELEFVKIGNKIHLSRKVLVEYLEENTVETNI